MQSGTAGQHVSWVRKIGGCCSIVQPLDLLVMVSIRFFLQYIMRFIRVIVITHTRKPSQTRLLLRRSRTVLAVPCNFAVCVPWCQTNIRFDPFLSSYCLNKPFLKSIIMDFFVWHVQLGFTQATKPFCKHILYNKRLLRIINFPLLGAQIQ